MPVPHLSYPFRVENGSAAVVEQDSFDEVAQCVAILLATPLGSRIEVPTYGVLDPVFSVTASMRHAAVMNAISEWEPRAPATLDMRTDALDDSLLRVSVAIKERGFSASSTDLPEVRPE